VKEKFSSRLSKAQGAAYQGAMEAVLAVPIAVGLGYWADTHFESSPRYMLVGAVIGFCAMVLRLVRMGPRAGQGSKQGSKQGLKQGAAQERSQAVADERAAVYEQHAEVHPTRAAQNTTTNGSREE
jgi:F0F1-type ATP synthase assembly protein I